MSPDLSVRARTLREAASEFAEAALRGDGEAFESALHARQLAFDAFLEAARGGIDANTRTLVEGVLALDQAVEQQARMQLAEIREELDRIRHARRVVAKQTTVEAPRFLSRRA